MGIIRIIKDAIQSMHQDMLFEMANLGIDKTGIENFIFISTRIGKYGPRIKYYLKPGEDKPSFTVRLSDFKIINDKLEEQVKSKTRKKVVKFAKLNKEDLIDFWFNGNSWTDNEVEEFKKNLKKVEES